MILDVYPNILVQRCSLESSLQRYKYKTQILNRTTNAAQFLQVFKVEIKMIDERK